MVSQTPDTHTPAILDSVPMKSRALLVAGASLAIGCSFITPLGGISDGVTDAALHDGEADGPTDAPADVDADVSPDLCAESSGLAWSKPVKVPGLAGPSGELTVQPYVLPDALSALFVVRTDRNRIYSGTRANVSASFAGASLLIDDGEYPATVPGLEEIVFTKGAQIWVATRTGASGPYLTHAYPPPVNSGLADDGASWPSLADGGRLMGFGAGPLYKWRLFEAHRTNVSPGANWVSVAELAELNDPARGYGSICPAYSDDGLRIWFSTNQTGGLLAYTARRTSLDAKFGSPVAVAAFAGMGPCPRAVSKDGCVMTLSCNIGGADVACVSKRIGAP